jgi:hypothetical protein
MTVVFPARCMMIYSLLPPHQHCSLQWHFVPLSGWLFTACSTKWIGQPSYKHVNEIVSIARLGPGQGATKLIYDHTAVIDWLPQSQKVHVSQCRACRLARYAYIQCIKLGLSVTTHSSLTTWVHTHAWQWMSNIQQPSLCILKLC